MQVRLESFDIKRIKEIAVLEGLDPESLSETEIWSIISAALVIYKRDLMEAQPADSSTKSEDD